MINQNQSQAVQKGQTSHPPNPGAPRRAFPHTRPQPMKAPGCSISHPPTPKPLRQLVLHAD